MHEYSCAGHEVVCACSAVSVCTSMSISSCTHKAVVRCHVMLGGPTDGSRNLVAPTCRLGNCANPLGCLYYPLVHRAWKDPPAATATTALDRDGLASLLLRRVLPALWPRAGRRRRRSFDLHQPGDPCQVDAAVVWLNSAAPAENDSRYTRSRYLWFSQHQPYRGRC